VIRSALYLQLSHDKELNPYKGQLPLGLALTTSSTKMLNIDDLKRIRTAIQTTPIIDNHAHNLLDKSSANHIPFESITTEAGEEALKTTFSSLSHLRARQQLKELYDYDGHDDNWDWPRLLKLRQDWMDNRQHELYQKCFKGTHVILMDDGLNLSGDVHSYQWHDQYTAAPTKRIVRIEREAELIMERLLATADPADAKSEEFQQKVHHSRVLPTIPAWIVNSNESI